MDTVTTTPRGGGRGSVTMIVASLAGALLVFALTGCSAAVGGSPKSTGATAAGDAASFQMCAECNGKGAPPRVKGVPALENGVQVVRIGVKNGYYAPNDIEIKAGVPVRLVFEGRVKGCLAKPSFPQLHKAADFTGGSAALDLGALRPGAYAFECAMGKNDGTVTAR